MPQVSLQLQDRDGKSVLYPLTPEEYTLKSLEEVPNTGDSESVNEFPVLGTSKAKAPEVQSRCEPGFGVMDVPGRKWVLGDTFLRRYYSIRPPLASAASHTLLLLRILSFRLRS
ncbi:unnamed protein product [Prorocentrum cordatum]|uniref:Uncharacterized protein n=1 Tax=Prorocentrum cordatum TaxID=2364126 RepID=A0ABN9UUE9_9DINO|nr:unnamed protein product [Polarella glacialis]